MIPGGTPIIPQNAERLMEEKLAEPGLREILRRALVTTAGKRESAISELPGWERLREQGRQIREYSIGKLGDLLEEFERKASAEGARVHYAGDAVEACSIIAGIARRKPGSVIVKSKSMVTEEIGLTPALEKQGHTVVETDLGEFIVQLAGEPPSHITGPAVHKSRADIGKLFASKFTMEYTDDPIKLTQVARDQLREYFECADVGITGANFAIASTGEIVVVENEGNARLTMLLPKTRIAVVGVEKILPDRESLAVLLELLARSATGQRLTSYTSLISGSKNQEVHIVIVDNGRTGMLADPVLREAMYCIRCGACMNACPVYQTVGGHAYGSIYPGPIGSVITPALWGLDAAKTLPYASSLCGACAEVCPVKIDLHHLLLEQRHRIVGHKLTGRFERFLIWKFLVITRSKFLYVLSLRLGQLVSRFASRNGRLTIPVWSKSREFPTMPRKAFRDQWKERP